MKKMFLFAVIAVFMLGCINKQEKLIEEFESVLGKPKIAENKDIHDIYYKWENISREKTHNLFDITDKTLNLLPTKKERMTHFVGYSFHDVNNYETEEYSITVKIYYINKEENVQVGLFLNNK